MKPIILKRWDRQALNRVRKGLRYASSPAFLRDISVAPYDRWLQERAKQLTTPSRRPGATSRWLRWLRDGGIATSKSPWRAAMLPKYHESWVAEKKVNKRSLALVLRNLVAEIDPGTKRGLRRAMAIEHGSQSKVYTLTRNIKYSYAYRKWAKYPAGAERFKAAQTQGEETEVRLKPYVEDFLIPRFKADLKARMVEQGL